ncbi:MAG: protein-glutamate O-methyltransferase CheR [Pseudomonadota bacterium]
MQETVQESDLLIKDGEFARFRDFFYRKTGIYFEDSKRYFVDKRLITRVKILNYKTFREYFTHLRFETDGKELEQLINAMTVNETYFYRESYQFDCLVNSALSMVGKGKTANESIKIWSLPSSTGEEAYSIALYLMENWPGINDYDIELFASDIDTSVLEKARRAVYGKRSVEGIPLTLKKKYFTELSDGRLQADNALRDCVEFTNVNIMDSQAMRYYRNFDVVFCRNMLIYFDDKSRRLAAEAIYDALAPGGILFLGHSESMSRISSLFKVIRFPETIAYQKA